MKRLLLFIACGLLLLTACAPQVDADEIAAMVASTLQAQQTLDAPQPTEVPSGPGTVEGAVCFPSSGIPPMNIYLTKVGTLETPLSFSIGQDQQNYSIEVAEGTYLAYAWLPDLSLGGAYTKAVACGLTADCTDHDLVQFHVPAGGTVSEIDICDWYTGPGDIPGPDGNYFNPAEGQNSGTQGMGTTGSGSGQSSPNTGTISGYLSYPSSFIPALNVIAFDMNNDYFYYITTSQGTSYYEISNLPPSTYYVVAYLAGEDYAAGYTNAVPCGLSVDCPNHYYIPVLVNAGDFVTEVNPQDWYAPEGTYPANPLP